MTLYKLLTKKSTEKQILVSWAVLVLSFLIVHFHRSALAVILDYLIIDLKIKDGVLAGTLAGIYAIIYMIMQIPSGLLADKFGPGRTVSIGMFTSFVGSIIFALAPSVFFAFIGRGLIALGVSVVFVSLMKFLADWFKPAQFTTISGISIFIGKVGAALGTTPMAYLVIGLGWRKSFMIIGAVSLFFAVLCFFLVRDRFPSDIKEGIKGTKVSNPNPLSAIKNIIKNPLTWPLFICAFGFVGTLLAFTGTWSIYYLMQMYNFSRSEAANYMLAVIIGSAIGYPLIGFISDKVSRRKLPFLVLSAFYMFLWAILFFWNSGKPPEYSLFPIFFLLGFTSSAFIIIPALANELNDRSFKGTAISVVNTAPFAGMSILQPVMGYVLDLRWGGLEVMGAKVYPLESYRLLFGLCLLILLVCFVSALKIKETRCQNIY